MKRFYRFELALLIFGIAGVGYFAAVQRGIDLLDWIGLGQEIAIPAGRVQMESRPVVITLSGELQPIREVDVVSRLAGRLGELRSRVGDRVTAGAVVGTVQSVALAERMVDVEAALQAARAEVREKKAQLADAEKRRLTTGELFRQDLIARRDLELAEQATLAARLQFETAGARLAQQEAIFAQAQKLRSLTTLIAPITGVVIRQSLSAGAPVVEDKTVLTIAQLDTLKLVAELPESLAGRIRPGMAVQIIGRSWSDSTLGGKITRVEIKEEQGQRLLLVESQFDNRERNFDPGVLVEAKLTLPEREEILLIPRGALQRQGRNAYVYKIDRGRAVRQEVSVDDSGAEGLIVRKGLAAGELVILEQRDGLKDGVRVRPLTAPEKPARRT